jgi:hypothetical protein
MKSMNLKERIKRIKIPLNVWTVGGFSLLLVVISYALLARSLGYYLDDWPEIYSLKTFGFYGIKQYFLWDARPIGYWPDAIAYALFGTNALLWHLNIYFLRWLTAMFMWATFIQVWPKHKMEISWATLLFAVYPLFAQMSTSVTFTAHFVCYLLFFLSTYFMVLALRKRNYFWLFTVLAVVLDLLNLFTYEYFIGVEFLRPFMIWFILKDQDEIKPKFGSILTRWSPYLGSSIAFVIYRIFLMQSPKTMRTPYVLAELLKNPLPTILELVQNAFKDSIQVVVEIWHSAFNPDIIDFSSPSLSLAWVIAFIAAAGFIAFAFFTRYKAESAEKNQRTFIWQGILIGVLGVLLGCAPGWAIGRNVSDDYGLWNDRFALAAMFGAAIFIIVFFTWLLNKHYWRKIVLFAILIGLAAAQNFRNDNDYRWSSTNQSRFAYQLTWRAPSIESPTAIFADNEMFTKMGVYPTSFMLNLLYPNQQSFGSLNFWFYTLNKYFPNDAYRLQNHITVTQGHWYANFTANTKNSLVISWHPGSPQCIWVLSASDRYNPAISDLTKTALNATNFNVITAKTNKGYPDVNLFGSQDENQWCYYFEKGDLDRQLGNWSDAVQLYETAVAKGLKTTFGQEQMPFIEAYAHLGNGEKALALTEDAVTKSENMSKYICDNWMRIYGEIGVNDSVKNAYEKIYKEYSCATVGQ